MEQLFDTISSINNFFWSYIGWLLIATSGFYLTFISKGLQFRALYRFPQNIRAIFRESRNESAEGISPFKLFFASVGGMVGLGNVVGISIALFIGGPGSIFWMVIASFCGMLLKYSEIYLGMKYRVKNDHGGFDSGPMYYIKKAFYTKFSATLIAVLIALYSIEIYQFVVLVDRIEYTCNFTISRNVIIATLLTAMIYSALGGIRRMSNICSFLMPIFMVSYILCSGYVIIMNYHLLPEFFYVVATSAFTGQAEIGGFVGSTMMLASYHGVSKAVYSGDIGVGYDAIVQSETKLSVPKRQATMAIYALCSDTIICLLTNTMLGVTGAWHQLNHLQPSDVVATILSNYFAYADIFVTLLLFFAGFTMIIAYLTAGTKCAEYLSPKYGKLIYLSYAVCSFVFFCNFSQEKGIIIMTLISGILVLLNVLTILKLRKQIEF